ncbi:MAG: TrkA family potassium uptake protein [Clostridia bacterium]|nr:MAG: TrkA family potassium uptake protein [Clostridia bacterium]
MQIVIVGASRLGCRLAQQLATAGHKVAVVDPRPEALDQLADDFPGQRVVGVGIDLDTLARAGAASADVLIAVTNRDSANIVSAQVARQKFNVPQVIARIYDPEAAQAYRQMGISVFCPTAAGLEYILSLVQGETGEGEV